jgi:hypothetical protein
MNTHNIPTLGTSKSYMRLHHYVLRLFTPICRAHLDKLVFFSILVVRKKVPNTLERIGVQIFDVVNMDRFWVAFVIENRQNLVVAAAFIRRHDSADDFTPDKGPRMNGIVAQNNNVSGVAIVGQCAGNVTVIVGENIRIMDNAVEAETSGFFVVLVFHIGALADFDDGVAHIGLLLVRGSFILL